MQQAALQSHCDISNNMNRYGGSIVSCTHQNAVPLINQSMVYKRPPQSFHRMTIPGPTLSRLANQSDSCRRKQWPLRWWHLLSQQTALEELSWETQKYIIPNCRCTAKKMPEVTISHHLALHRSLAGVLICFYALLVVKWEYHQMTAEITCILDCIK